MINTFLGGLVKEDNCQQALSFFGYAYKVCMERTQQQTSDYLNVLKQLRRMRKFQLLTCIQCEYIWVLFDLKPPNQVNYRRLGALIIVMIRSVHN
jgi:hypothetical protein